MKAPAIKSNQSKPQHLGIDDRNAESVPSVLGQWLAPLRAKGGEHLEMLEKCYAEHFPRCHACSPIDPAQTCVTRGPQYQPPPSEYTVWTEVLPASDKPMTH